MKYAVIASGGKQYKVTEGQVIEVDKLPVEVGITHAFEQILLSVDGSSVTLGDPYIHNTAVTAEVVEQTQGDKIRVAKFKAKARYRKVQGFRAQLTRVRITSLAGKVEQSEKLKA
ncbi:MAG: 50S ribosomal protein L21 [Candidatus Levyibacteriota bacterium]